jgi:hypothetical protein
MNSTSVVPMELQGAAYNAADTGGLTPMEGKGAYNRHVQRPNAAGSLAIPLLEQAARAIEVPPADRPFVIADYGSSQGRNSLRPLRAAIAVMRERIGLARPICVIHTDLPDNDFGSLFQVLQTDPDSYMQGDPNVYYNAIGRSFYEGVLPPNEVSLGWSSYAACWLSRVPAYIPGHFHDLRATGTAREAFDAQAAMDWATFLSLRARELRPTGRLVVVLPAIDEAGIHGIEPLLDAANECLGELVADGSITTGERSRMVTAGRLRSRAQLLAPFAATGSFANLLVEHCEISRVPEAAWAEYSESGDAQGLATRRARFFRAVFVPILATALEPARPSESRTVFADRLEAALTRRLVSTKPDEIPGTAAILVVARKPE